MSNDDFSREKWVEFYQLAFLEFKHALMAGRIADARAAIIKHLETLRTIPGLHTKEQQSIVDAQRALQILEREKEKVDAHQQRAAGQKALEKLSSIAPVTDRLKSESAD